MSNSHEITLVFKNSLLFGLGNLTEDGRPHRRKMNFQQIDSVCYTLT
jgi:hypothetical protein